MALKFLSNVSTSAAGTAATLVNEASASLSSATLASMVTSETGSGALVFATSPTLTTPNIGAATGTSLQTSGAISTTAGNISAIGTVTARDTSTRDGVILQGRSGGTNTRSVTITPATLSGNQTLTLPDATGTLVTTATGSLTSANLLSMLSDETGTGVAVFGTAPTISLANINNVNNGFSTTATAAGSTTLTVNSNFKNFFTGTSTQTVVLPVASTMQTGMTYEIHNNSTGTVTVNSSGGGLVSTLGAGASCQITCILTSGTTAASWSMRYLGAVLG